MRPSFASSRRRASSCRAARTRSTEPDSPRAPQIVFDLGVPVLGICYGMQTMADQLGGKVELGKLREFGYAEVRAHNHTSFLDGHRGFPRRPKATAC